MGGERASSIRQRMAGKTCYRCKATIDAAPTSRERLCAGCAANQPRHRILLNFMLARGGWEVSFLEADCKTSLRKHLRFAIPEKIIDLARRGGADLTSASRCDLENGIANGRGGIWLNLTPEQYAKLREP